MLAARAAIASGALALLALTVTHLLKRDLDPARTMILSLTLGGQPSHAALPLLPLTAAIWLGLIVMVVIAARVGPDHGPNPHVPRLLGWANRLMMVAHCVWLIVAAWPMAR